MNPRHIAILLFVAALPLWGCGGDRTENAKRDVRPIVVQKPGRWQPGDVLTREATDTHTDRLTKVLPDGVVSTVRNSEETITSGWMEKCLEVDEDGARARYLVYIREWLRKSADTRDDSLQRAYVDVSGRGPAREWSLVGDDKQPSDAAKKWLDARFGAPRSGDDAGASFLLDDEQLRPLMLTDRPLTPGESWKPDVLPLADAVSKGGKDIDRSKVEATATLVGVNEGTAHALFEASLPLATAVNDQPWTKGGVIMIRIDAYFPPAERLGLPSNVDCHAALDGQVNVQGTTMGLAGHFRETRRTKVGGDFPEPK